MKSLFEKDTYETIVNRLNNLSPQSQRQWGKMDAAQMLAHCKEAFKVPLSDKPQPILFMGILFGWMMKSKLYNEAPWGKSLPTAPNFIIKDQRNFEIEKAALLSLISQFNKANPATIEKNVHPFFGKITGRNWGKGMYKHLDHHFQQFAV